MLELDPNPYWTGWPTARPVLKRACHELVDGLLLADALRATRQIGEDRHPALAGAWWIAATSNHHDFVSGTSTDRVVESEQLPWVRQATALVRKIVAEAVPAAQRVEFARPAAAEAEPGAADRRLAGVNPLEAGRSGTTGAAEAPKAPEPSVGHQVARRSPSVGRPTWRLSDGLLEVETPFFRCELAEEAGGCILQILDPSGRRLLDGPSADIISYFDSGGLWRLGAEFAGGSFREVAHASQRPARLRVRECEDGLAVISALHMDGMTLVRRLTFGCVDPLVGLEVEGLAGEKRTLTLRLETGLAVRELWMDTPGGTVTRPLRRRYDPTFWALHSFVHLQGEDRDTSPGNSGAEAVARPAPSPARPAPSAAPPLPGLARLDRRLAGRPIGGDHAAQRHRRDGLRLPALRRQPRARPRARRL